MSRALLPKSTKFSGLGAAGGGDRSRRTRFTGNFKRAGWKREFDAHFLSQFEDIHEHAMSFSQFRCPLVAFEKHVKQDVD